MKHSKLVASLLVTAFAFAVVPALASQSAQPQCGDEKKDSDKKDSDKKDGDKKDGDKPKAPSRS